MSLGRALAGASLVAAAAIVCGPAAIADPNQDEQFLTLLSEKQIPALDNEPALIARAHEICGEFDNGIAFGVILDEERNRAYEDNPLLRLQSARITTTMIRFVSAAVEVYCPRHRGQLP